MVGSVLIMLNQSIHYFPLCQPVRRCAISINDVCYTGDIAR